MRDETRHRSLETLRRLRPYLAARGDVLTRDLLRDPTVGQVVFPHSPVVRLLGPQHSGNPPVAGRRLLFCNESVHSQRHQVVTFRP